MSSVQSRPVNPRDLERQAHDFVMSWRTKLGQQQMFDFLEFLRKFEQTHEISMINKILLFLQRKEVLRVLPLGFTMPGHKLHVESGAKPLYLLKQVTSGLSVYDVELFYDVQDWKGWQVPETVIYEDEKMVLDQKNRFLNESRYAAFVNSVAAPLKPTASALHARFNKNLVFVDSKQSLERQFATFVHAFCVNHIERTTSVRGENSDRVAFFMTFLIGRHYGIDEAWIEETDFRFLDPNVAYATLTVAYNLFLGLLPKLPG